ncbi:hybrid sensor histidine kinase/response regulator [Microbaculum marinum]|uniref:histidine kinase n=1 Tax=Microbaculum marinum TaxID=1764581 RepID=A0AAW9S2A4_9HYPH
MAGLQRILPVRRRYNQWVANQTLEDYALRFTAKSARRWSAGRVAQTAIGAISFLALEAIGGAITLSYGFTNAVAAIGVVCVVLLITGLPISSYAARYGVDIDLLTRGSGFGYIGSTITSLIYATFTFILFAIEASIMSSALELCLGIPLWIGYIVSTVVVIPLVTHGITWISRFQIATQPLWIVLNILPLAFILTLDWPSIGDWMRFGGTSGIAAGTDGTAFDILRFGAAASVILALMPQIGEQVDILRFLPARRDRPEPAWRGALLAGGAGWIIWGAPKLLFGSFLAVLATGHGVPFSHAAEPAYMYNVAFGYVFGSPHLVLATTAVLVVVSQLKINVMNAYAGSLAWSNFFARLTHSHPGRVVWLIFNVAIALLLMELGIYRALEQTLGLFAIVAVAWLGAIVADLGINKPLGLSPPGIEFKRAHLYDVNPVGVGAMAIAIVAALVARIGLFGPAAEALAPFVALATALVAAPAIAYVTRGRFALARKPRRHWKDEAAISCGICENAFEPEDMAFCPAYGSPICSLCCSLDARCHDLCKPKARFNAQALGALRTLLPEPLAVRATPRVIQYMSGMVLSVGVIGLVLSLIWYQLSSVNPAYDEVISRALWAAFFILLIIAGIATWFVVLTNESRRVAEEESGRQNRLLLREIEAHKRTDAALQKAKEVAEAANLAKSRYVVGMSHELRTPLNAVLGYAQLLEHDENGSAAKRQNGVRVIRRSAEHLSGLIDGLLDISKIEAGRLQIQRDQVRIADFLDQLVDMFRLQAEARSLTFRFECSPALPEVVRTDEKRLRQILINLLSNAIKFTDSGDVALKVAYKNQIATFTVSDTGIGIAEGDRETIFEPFQRISRPAGAGKAPGLGLGLTITRMLVELMGGELTLESEPGRGSSFSARLMLTAIDSPQAVVRKVGRPRGYEGPRRTVMVVDDDPTHRDLVCEILRPLDFAVLTAEDGAGCLSMLETAVPDLFILDISMPGLDGWELARRIRAGGHARARILMLSANIGDRLPAPTEDAPHDDTMAKPFNLQQLLDRIQALLGIVWIETEPVPQPAPPSLDEIRSPGAEHVAELHRLGSIGYVRGIEAKLEALESVDANRPFVAEMRRLVRNFDFRRYMAVLEAIGHDD